MEDIINYIIEKEKEAERVVQQAREEASDVIREAEKKVSEIVTRAKDEAQKILKDKVESVQEDIERKKTAEIQKLNRVFDNFIDENKDLIGEIIQKVIDTIIHTEYDEE